MALPAALTTIGYLLLIAIGLILLLFIIVLAVAFLLTLLMHFYADISARKDGDKIKKRINIRFKMPFYEYVLLDIDDFEETEEIPEPDSEKKAQDPEKSTYHVTVTDEKICVEAAESKKHSDEYEIIVHTEEPAKDSVSAGAEPFVSDAPEHFVPEVEFEETESSFEEIESSFEEVSDVHEYEAYEAESEETDPPSCDIPSDDSDASDFSETYDEIKKYVDLSNPEQFASDSVTAAIKMAKASARMASDLLLRINIDKMSGDFVYGLSDPANTALSYGAVHSFNASVYAYLDDAAKTSRSSKKRRKARELSNIIRDDIRIVPDMTKQTFEADTDMFFSFWIPRSYIPTLRFLFNKNTRWVIRHYLYPYFIRHSIRTWRAERKQRKSKKEMPNAGSPGFGDAEESFA